MTWRRPRGPQWTETDALCRDLAEAARVVPRDLPALLQRARELRVPVERVVHATGMTVEELRRL